MPRPGRQDDLGPVVERPLAVRGMAAVVRLVLRARGGEAASRPAATSVSSVRSGSSSSQTGSRPGPKQVLRRRHAPARQLRHAPHRRARPARRRPSSKWSTTRSGCLSAPRTTGSTSSARRRRCSPARARPGAAEAARRPRPRSREIPVDACHRSRSGAPGTAPRRHPRPPVRDARARGRARARGSAPPARHRPRERKARAHVRHVHDAALEQLRHQPFAPSPSLTLVRLIVATSWVCAITRCGSSEWSGVSTLGAGPSASMHPAMNRIISASHIASAWRSAPSRGQVQAGEPRGPMVPRSVPLPFTSRVPPTLIEVLPPPGCTSRGSWPIRRERRTGRRGVERFVGFGHRRKMPRPGAAARGRPRTRLGNPDCANPYCSYCWLAFEKRYENHSQPRRAAHDSASPLLRLPSRSRPRHARRRAAPVGPHRGAPAASRRDRDRPRGDTLAKRVFRIEAQPLPGALEEFRRQSGVRAAHAAGRAGGPLPGCGRPPHPARSAAPADRRHRARGPGRG